MGCLPLGEEVAVLEPAAVGRLRDALVAAGYTADGVRTRLGPVAAAALDREQPVPARRVLADDASPLATLTRLFLLGDAVAEQDALAALGELAPLAPLLTRPQPGQVAGALELAPYRADSHDWWIAADWSPWRTGRAMRPDHVLGAGGASTMLAQTTVRPRVSRALDLGTGSGVQALHLAQHADLVVGTDLSARALAMARLTAGLAGVDLELRQGDLFAPVAGERFDLIVSNPPFVVSPPGAARHYDYRDAGLAGDEVCRRVVAQAEAHLADGGWCQLLANWEIRAGQPWSDGPARWLAGSGLDSWVVQREVQDPAEYAETWLRDAGDDRGDPAAYAALYAHWLDDFAARGVEAIGFGLITLHAAGAADPLRRFQHVPQRVVQPLGPHVQAWFAAYDRLRAHPGAQVLLLPLARADDVRVDTRAVPGADAEERVVLRETGFCWSAAIDEVGIAVLAGAEGTRPVGEVVQEAAARLGVDPVEALAGSVEPLRRLVQEGFLVVPAAG